MLKEYENKKMGTEKTKGIVLTPCPRCNQAMATSKYRGAFGIYKKLSVCRNSDCMDSKNGVKHEMEFIEKPKDW